jgi:hypothetical protein
MPPRFSKFSIEEIDRRISYPGWSVYCLSSRPANRCACSWDSGKVHDPVRRPGLATVLGKCLFPASGCRRDVGPNEPSADRLPVERPVGIERTDSIVETAFHRRIESAERIATVDPPNCPLRRFRIVCAQSDTVSDATWPVERVAFDVRRAVHERAIATLPIEFQPFMTVDWALYAMMDTPLTD